MKNEFRDLICEKCGKIYSGILKIDQDSLCPICKRKASIEYKWKNHIKNKSVEERLKEVEIFMLSGDK